MPQQRCQIAMWDSSWNYFGSMAFYRCYVDASFQHCRHGLAVPILEVGHHLHRQREYTPCATFRPDILKITKIKTINWWIENLLSRRPSAPAGWVSEWHSYVPVVPLHVPPFQSFLYTFLRSSHSSTRSSVPVVPPFQSFLYIFLRSSRSSLLVVPLHVPPFQSFLYTFLRSSRSSTPPGTSASRCSGTSTTSSTRPTCSTSPSASRRSAPSCSRWPTTANRSVGGAGGGTATATLPRPYTTLVHKHMGELNCRAVIHQTKSGFIKSRKF